MTCFDECHSITPGEMESIALANLESALGTYLGTPKTKENSLEALWRESARLDARQRDKSNKE